MIGSDGDDVLMGGLGADQLSAEDGDDILIGPAGDGSRDNVIGGNGTDTCSPVGPDPDLVIC
ncbi:MAG: hypothetical protein ABR540_02595 [Acidimicrobiales bacterium]